MSVNENGNPRPDGFSASLPLLPFVGIGGTYYWNPGSPTAPNLTLTGGLGTGGGGLHSVFLRKGMTSRDTLGYGANANVWMLPRLSVEEKAVALMPLFESSTKPAVLANARQSIVSMRLHRTRR
jgi:hypothetical protein